MNNQLRFIFTALLIVVAVSFQGCSDLEEVVTDGVRQEASEAAYAVNSDDNFEAAIDALRTPYQNQDQLFELNEHTTDACVGPTRGGDWDDGGVFRAVHAHTYAPDHRDVGTVYNNLYAAVNSANLVLGSSVATDEQKSQIRLIRALHYYTLLDLYGSVLYKEIGEPTEKLAIVWDGATTVTWLIEQIDEAIKSGHLATSTSLDVASKAVPNENLAHWLLAKIYLNRAVFESANRASVTAAQVGVAENMDKVITHVDAITGVKLASDYWDNFRPKNTETSEEIIFVSQNFGGNTAKSPIRNRWYMGQHYNQTPGGWNGFATVGEYYDKFDADDPRILTWDDDVMKNNGYNLGFHVGQQYGPGGPSSQGGDGEELDDRKGNKLIFQKDVALVVSDDATIELAGYRGVKYAPDNTDGNSEAADNDFVIARYADALLMKAEALARKGDNAGAQTLVQQLANESSTTIGSVDDILDVRARELWWEGFRRNDMIRFGTFLNSRELKPTQSAEKYILFPFPADALANPNLTQNAGY